LHHKIPLFFELNLNIIEIQEAYSSVIKQTMVLKSKIRLNIYSKLITSAITTKDEQIFFQEIQPIHNKLFKTNIGEKISKIYFSAISDQIFIAGQAKELTSLMIRIVLGFVEFVKANTNPLLICDLKVFPFLDVPDFMKKPISLLSPIVDEAIAASVDKEVKTPISKGCKVLNYIATLQTTFDQASKWNSNYCHWSH
jgi:hypothetical protein